MRYNEDRGQIELGVRELCALALSYGDIDCRRPSAPLYERGAEGSRIHGKIRRQISDELGEDYHGEVELRNTSKLGDIYFHVSGRADGVAFSGGEYTVDEIKTVSGGIFDSGADDRRHIAQLYCYAYFLCCIKDIDELTVRLIYYNTDDGDMEFRERRVSREALREFYTDLLSAIEWRARLICDRAEVRLPAAASAKFPYPNLRESQEEMIRECYRDIKQGNRLFCQAPTGIGKTVSTLFPSVRCLGEGYADKIFYLTAKSGIKREAYNAAGKMNEAGVGVRSCILSAREQACVNQAAKARAGRLSSNCNPDFCPYAKGYYDRADGALRELLSSSDRYDRETIKAVAQKHRVCPYEFSLDLSELCDIIICDYNYLISPTARLKRYFEGDGRGEKYIFLVDEAHNLPDRARATFSSRVDSGEVRSLMARLEEKSPFRDSCEKLLGAFEELSRLCRDNMRYDSDGVAMGYYVSRQLPEKFHGELARFGDRCDSWMKKNPDHAAFLAAEELSYKIYEFGKICERFDKRYLTFVETVGEQTSLLLYCLDPSYQLSLAFEKARASVLFSATLTPTEYFADILGGGKSAISVSFRSPFDSKNLCVAAVDTVSTRYEDREQSYKKIASCIAATVSAKAGNYMVFFPSYDYMEKVRKPFAAKYPKVKLLVQKKNMRQSDREEFLSGFKDDEGVLRIGFCVLGGLFSEGIDLPGNRLIGAIVVGVGLPGISDENNIIRDYYEESCGAGYDYAYTYPGMNSVLQAVGRVIRTETDRGIAVLIDDRYAEPKYRALFPAEWKGIKFAGNSSSLAEIARRFWKNGE